MRFWHVNLPKELKEPVWALARKQNRGIQETMVELVRFALTRPEALHYYFVMEQNKLGEADERQEKGD